MKFRFVVLKLYSSIYKRIHSWGLFLLLMILYASSLGIQSTMLLRLFGRLGLMSVHVLSGFGLILAFIIIAYNYLQNSVFHRKVPAKKRKAQIEAELYSEKSGTRHLVDLLFYLMLSLVCGLGLFYYFIKQFSITFRFIHLSSLSSLHAIVGWFFISLVFIKYYLTIIQWFREFYRYLRE